MKTIISVLLAFVLASSAWAEKPAVSPLTADPGVMLDAAARQLDSIVANALAALDRIASTPEAKRGDWNGIKRHLKLLEPGLPGVYFFVLPNGNYYSVALDYTNLNLSDRPYFKPLFAGNRIRGFPIYSRSTGEKSALVAVPIVVNDQVIGALGTSIFLGDLNAKLDRALALPQGYTWYVLNSEGNTMLHKHGDFIFVNALTEGSQSLREAASNALKRESGTMQYELGAIRHAHYQKLPSLDWWMFLAEIEAAKTQTPPQLKLSLERFVPDLQRSLDQIDASLTRRIESSKVNVAKESEIRKLLSALLDENPDIVDAAFIDSKGVLRHIEPRDYRNFENVDISSQAHIATMLKNPAPVLSSGFMAVEHFLAVVIAHPLYDGEKRLVGSISILIRPDLLIRPLLKKSAIPDGYELWIMQPDGMIIYDQDKQEIGRMLFSDPLYAGYDNLLKLGKRIASTPAGQGSYIFMAPELKGKVIKNAVWQTVKLHEREWRVVLVHRPYE